MNKIFETLISVIIPCYNAQKFISETIQSVLKQSFQDFEIIVINDGSNDTTEAQILAFTDSRIRYYKKDNTGVSDTRNKGITLSRGKFILFLDADDVLNNTFLEKRLEQLQKNPGVLFCCGQVIKIDDEGNVLQGIFRGTWNEIFQDVLTYDPEIITCPSNYLFRKDILIKHCLSFNTSLSSTADRFFLIELATFGKGIYVEDGGELYYRVSGASMSHRISLPLIEDNELFYKALISKKDNIPKDVYKKFLYKINYILGAGYMSLKVYDKGLLYFAHSFIYNPVNFTSSLVRKIV